MQVRPAGAGDRPAWEAYVAARPEADPLQAWAWGEANATAGERPARLVATAEDGTVRGVAQLLVRSAGFGRTVIYVPHGPLWDRDAPDAAAIRQPVLTPFRVSWQLLSQESTGMARRGLGPRGAKAAAGRVVAPAGNATQFKDLQVDCGAAPRPLRTPLPARRLRSHRMRRA